ncbi:hypothetical protein RHSP_43907 [Rhizobium freirei PRF 81]|uniref:Uncharacterized protein n=1 Tax=Rhizobium freirei PRF 81 TaxID=363754 RepID=N6V928_9HYPH|nr:hypothetical protein RHSP_43907 [Rhizobium freirei PRF 81]
MEWIARGRDPAQNRQARTGPSRRQSKAILEVSLRKSRAFRGAGLRLHRLERAGVLQDIGCLLGRGIKRLLGAFIAKNGRLKLGIDDVGNLDPLRRARNREGVFHRFLEGAQHFLLVRVGSSLLDIPIPYGLAGRQGAVRSFELLRVVVGQEPDERSGRVLMSAGFGHREAMMAGPAGVLAGRAGRLHHDADIAGNLRRLRIVEIGRPARPVEIKRDGTGREAGAEVVPQIVGRTGRNGLGLVHVDEPVERTHAGFGVEGRLAVLAEILAAFSDQHFIETAVDGLFLAGELRAEEVRRIGEERRLVGDFFPGLRRRKIVAVLVLEGLLLGVVLVEALLIVERRDVELGARQHDQAAVDGRGLDGRIDELADFFLRQQLAKVGVKVGILRREGRMVRADAPGNAARRHVGLDFLVEFEVVLLGQNVDLGARRLLPLGDARIKRLILLSADELGVDRHARKFARQIGGEDRRARKQCHHAGSKTGPPIPHRNSSLNIGPLVRLPSRSKYGSMIYK